MSSLVIQLQQAALDKSYKITDLLRLALVVARKLKVADLEAWIQSELDGYKLLKDAPQYRVLRGSCQALHAYHGWQPVHFKDQKTADTVSVRPICDPIGSIADHVVRADTSGGHLSMQMPPSITNQLMKSIGFGFTDIQLRLEVASFVNILEAVRTSVLDWSLKLEEAGVLGEGMIFSPTEQSLAKTAAVAPTYQATNMTFVHSMEQSQLQQGSPGATQTFTVKTVDLAKLKDFIQEIQAIADQVPESDRPQFDSDLATLEAQASAPKPSPGIVIEAAGSVRKILESAGGGLLAANLPHLLQKAAALFS
jgi:hypothetical protein